MSAYACRPGLGSEPGTGWAWARAAALDHHVWLLTRKTHRTAILEALRLEPDLRITPIFLDMPNWVLAIRRERWVRTYYTLWQALARREAKQLHSKYDFNVAHHVTFAADWLPAGVVGIPGLPSVWGPVGGTAPLPWVLREWLGLRGLVEEVLRVSLGWAGRLIFGDWAAKRATVVVAQNHEVAGRFRLRTPVVEPHVALESSCVPNDSIRADDCGERTALFVGRLVAWKGIGLAVRTMAEPNAAKWRLEVIGEGPQRRAAVRLADRLGIADRVRFRGQCARPEVLEAYHHADALLFPSMHDSGGWVVGEAVMADLPVVCLDICGPSVLVERTSGGRSVPLSKHSPRDLALALIAIEKGEIGQALSGPISAERLPALLSAWYVRATGADLER